MASALLLVAGEDGDNLVPVDDVPVLVQSEHPVGIPVEGEGHILPCGVEILDVRRAAALVYVRTRRHGPGQGEIHP
jgi:hypothetical protein